MLSFVDLSRYIIFFRGQHPYCQRPETLKLARSFVSNIANECSDDTCIRRVDFFQEMVFVRFKFGLWRLEF